MANALSIYGGTVHANQQDGDLITNERRITISGIRADTVTGCYALRASADYPACIITLTVDGADAGLFKLSTDGVNFYDVIHVFYVGDYNVLFWIKAEIPENKPFGVHSNADLVCDYMGGV